MDLTKVFAEPQRKRMELVLSQLWLVAALQVRSKILQVRIEEMIKHYGHVIGIQIAEYSVTNQHCVFRFSSGRTEHYVWQPLQTHTIDLNQCREMVDSIQSDLWGMMEHLRLQKQRASLH